MQLDIASVRAVPYLVAITSGTNSTVRDYLLATPTAYRTMEMRSAVRKYYIELARYVSRHDPWVPRSGRFLCRLWAGVLLAAPGHAYRWVPNRTKVRQT